MGRSLRALRKCVNDNFTVASLLAEIDHPRDVEFVCEQVGFEVGPARDLVEDCGVGGDGDTGGGDEGGVGVEDDFYFPRPVVTHGEVGEFGGEAAAVGDGAIEEPEDV